jgi:hypothetical protein
MTIQWSVMNQKTEITLGIVIKFPFFFVYTASSISSFIIQRIRQIVFQQSHQTLVKSLRYDIKNLTSDD